MRNLLFKTY